MKKKLFLTGLIVVIILLWFFSTKHVSFLVLDNSLIKRNVELLDTTSACINGINDSVVCYNNIKSQPEDVGELTLFVNGINNIISTYGVVLAIITVLLVIAGFYSISTITNSLEKFEKRFEKKLEEGEKSIDVFQRHFRLTTNSNKKQNDLLIADFNKQIETIDNLEERIKRYTQFAYRSNTYIYDAINQMAALAEPNRGKALMEKITTDMQRLHLFSENKDERIAALYYFGEKGTKEHLDELREVAKSDLDEEIRQLAAKVIGRIEEREEKRRNTSEIYL